jgi:DNA-binding beta-propeller fold protein YncE
MNRFHLTLVTFALALTLTASAHGQDGPYKVLTTQTVGGEGGYDYLAADVPERKLFIARSGPAGSLHVYDLDTLAPLGEVPTGSAHGTAIDPELHHGFATARQVVMFDTQTLKVLKTLPTAGNPDGYLTDTAAHRVYVLSHSEPNVTVLDSHDGAVLGTLNLGGAPEQSQLDGKGHLFIDLEDKAAIAVVDTATLTVTAKYDVSSVGGGCAGLALDTEHNVLFAACHDKSNMVILRASDGHIITTLPTGSGCDGAVFNPKTNEVYSTQGDGTLTVIHEQVPSPMHINRLRTAVAPSSPANLAFSVEQTLATPPRARTIAFDDKTGHILTATADFGSTPPPVPGQKYARPRVLPGTFKIIVIGK